MNEKLVKLLKSWRVWLLIFSILVSLLAINYHFGSNTGVVISGVSIGSPAYQAGISVPENLQPTDLEQILYINDYKINTLEDYYKALDSIPLKNDTTITIITNKNKNGYVLHVKPEGNKSLKDIIGLSVRNRPRSNIRLGIELEGGSRLILEPEKNLTDAQFDVLIQNLRNRLDVYGASGTKISKIEDAFSGKKYILVESPSSNKDEILKLLEQQGHFVAKLGNETVFTGKDVQMVYTDPQHAGLERCAPTPNNEYVCTYRFEVQISSKAAGKFLDVAKKIPVVTGNDGQEYLKDKITFFLDGKNITSLNVAASFKYQKITTPTITVSGAPAKTLEEAKYNGKKQMKFLQALLSTESLNTKLKVVQSYGISSSIGKRLLHNSILVGILAMLAVATVVAIRYRNWIIFLSIIITLISELIIILGTSAFMKLTVDLAAIGGLIAAIGTGVDDQIIITDEYFRRHNQNLNRKKKVKKAFVLILMSYFTTVAAMFPVSVAGLKLLQGFAVTIILGVTIGVLITRPAFGEIIQILIDRKEK